MIPWQTWSAPLSSSTVTFATSTTTAQRFQYFMWNLTQSLTSFLFPGG